MAFEDPDLTGYEKQLIMLQNLYPVIPENVQKACELATKFLDGGNEREKDEGASSPRLYSFAKDAGFIFSAFKQTHGIDLETADLHWWKFLALFMDLGSETTFCNLVSLRKRIKTGKATKEERATAREMGDIFVIPELLDLTPEERESGNEFMRALEAAQQRAKEGK